MDPGGGGFYRNVVYNDVAREFQPADERRSDLQPPPPPPPPPPACDRYGDFRGSDEPMVLPRLAVAPPPPPPAPAGGPEMGQISGGYLQSVYGNNAFQTEYFQVQGGGYGNEGFPTHGSGVGNVVPVVYPIGSGGASGTTLFVGDLHWWTTDAEIEAELCKYGQVKDVKYFDDWFCGKSSGFCQVEFYDPIAAAACEDGMNGHIFNGRPCVVALASPHDVRKMGERQMNKNRPMTGAPEPPAPPQEGRGGGRPPVGNNFGRGGGGGGSWGRGGRMGSRGPMNAPPPPPVWHPGAMLCQGFNPMGYGAAMGGMAAGFRGFPAAAPGGVPFPGMIMPPFPPIVAPPINPAFFGRGSSPAGVGMWSHPNMSGRGGGEQSSYGDASHRKSSDEMERDSGRQKEMNWERDRERQRDKGKEPKIDRKRDRHRDDRYKHGDHYRHRDREPELGGRSSSSRPRSRSREDEHSKRRRQSP